MTTRIASLADITPAYDVLFCDVWGVLHNGVAAFSGAVSALSAARAAGIKVILLTNSPRPAPSVARQLDMIGVPQTAWDRIVTSGDVTRALIAQIARPVFHLGPERDQPLFDGLPVSLVAEADAEAIVCTGLFNDETETAETYRPMFARLVPRGLPFVCANPDLFVERGDRVIPCAGALAELYARMGGDVRIAGKPHRPIYDLAFEVAAELLGTVDPARVLAIGDGMLTDVKGALDRGLDLLYVSGGIHARDYVERGVTDEARLAAFLARHGAQPRHWIESLS